MFKQLFASVAILAILLGGSRRVSAGNIVYASTTLSQFGTLNLQTGAFTEIGPDAFFQDLARLAGGPLYAIDNSQQLRIVNVANGSSAIVGPSGNFIQGLAIRQDGTLFGLSHQNLYTIDKTTGAATLVGFMGKFNGLFDAKFDNAGNLFLATTTGNGSSLYSVDAATGLATLIGPIGFSVPSLDVENGTLYGFTADDKIITFDTTSGAGTFVVQTNPLREVFGAAPATGVPEPATIVLLSAGALGLMLHTCRRWKNR
jgi:hypothetical protein